MDQFGRPPAHTLRHGDGNPGVQSLSPIGRNTKFNQTDYGEMKQHFQTPYL